MENISVCTISIQSQSHFSVVLINSTNVTLALVFACLESLRELSFAVDSSSWESHSDEKHVFLVFLTCSFSILLMLGDMYKEYSS